MTRKRPSTTRAIVTLSAVAAVYVIAVLWARHAFQDSLTETPAPSGGTQAAAPPSRVVVGGVTLTSVSIAFPADEQPYAGPGADVMNADCTACHSANMALNQPRLSATDWKAEVDKMRGTYKATVADKDVPAILKYLNGMSARLPAGGAPAPSAPSGSSSSVSG